MKKLIYLFPLFLLSCATPTPQTAPQKEARKPASVQIPSESDSFFEEIEQAPARRY